MKPDLGALRERDFRRLLLAKCASLSGDFVSLIGIPAAVFALGGSQSQIGIVFAVYFLTVAIGSSFGGGLSDKFPRSKVMMWGDLVCFGGQACFAVLLLSGKASFPAFLIVEFFLGVGTAIFVPGMNRLVNEITETSSRQGANALLSIASSSATMLGPAVAVLLIDQVGVGWAFAFDAASFLASAVLLRGIKLTGEAEAATVTVGVASAAATPAAEAADSTEEGLGILEGWRQLRGLTWLWVIVLEFAILNGLAFGPFQVFGAALGHQTFGMGNWALVLSAQGFGAVVGGIVGLFWRPERPLLVGSAAVGTFAVPMILLGAEAPVVVIAATAMVAGAGIAFFDTVWSTTIQDHAPEDAMSRISAIDLAGSYALLPGGMLMAAFLLVLIGPSGGLFFSGAVVAVGTAMVLNVPSVRRLRSKPVDP